MKPKKKTEKAISKFKQILDVEIMCGKHKIKH